MSTYSSLESSPTRSNRGRSTTASSSSNVSSTGLQTPPNLHQNSMDPAASWIVQKYGGTSVGKFAAKIAEDIVPTYLDQHKVAIVCSARSGSTKALGTTNLLLRAASEALQRNTQPSCTSGLATPITPASSGIAHSKGFLPRKDSVSNVNATITSLNGLSMTQMSRSRAETSCPGSPRSASASPSPFSSLAASMVTQTQTSYSAAPANLFQATVDLLRLDHLTAARASVRDQDLLKELEQEIERDCEGLRSFLFAAQIIDEISPRSRDNIVGVGERLSCKLVAAVLRDRGVDAEFVSLENIVPVNSPDDTDVDHSSKEQGSLDQSFYDYVAQAVGERLRQCGSRVPVVTGFFGPVPGSLLRQVGRGYTDLLAALAAVGLSASELQIWKEVDGIFTADPRKVPTARLIPVISPDEAAELTYYGSEVVHPFTMEQVIRRKIPIRIKNVENPAGGGTVIHPDPDVDITTLQVETASPLDFLESSSAAFGAMGNDKKLPTAVTIKENITILNVHSNRKSVSHGFFARIFSTLDKFGVVVDLISTSEVHVSMAIENGLGKRLLERLVKELQSSGTVTVHPDMAILSLVGKQMQNLVGIAGRMFTTLASGDVNIEMISQGASEINISCCIDGRDAVKALNLIHQTCLQVQVGSPTAAGHGRGGSLGHWLF